MKEEEVKTTSSHDAEAVQMAADKEEDEEEEIVLRANSLRPVHKLSVKLIDTYKYINKVYYEAKAKRLKQKDDSHRGGVHNDGYDDQNYDYIFKGEELFNDRYVIKHRMGKGSFGQVFCAYDQERKCEVALKIIKSRKPFLVQAQTEIALLTKINEKDTGDDKHLVKLLDSFVYRNHQCLVFEILSYNLYELLRNTKFRGVSLTLIRKFSIQLLRALELLSRPDVDIIHCDLKPENILLRHPRRSAIKVIDFGSSCYSSKRTFTYIQSRFYRSPEVLLSLPYSHKIDVWSLGCVLAEMHIGEPLFGGTTQADQMCRIVDVLGMPPLEMVQNSPEKTRNLFFEKTTPGSESTLPASCDLSCTLLDEKNNVLYVLKRPHRDMPKPRKLQDILGVYTGGPAGRRAGEPNHTVERYEEFLDFISHTLIYEPEKRASAAELGVHPYVLHVDDPLPDPPVANPTAGDSKNIPDGKPK
eukprot:gene34545-41826_t